MELPYYQYWHHRFSFTVLYCFDPSLLCLDPVYGVVVVLLFLVSRPYAMPELWVGGVPTSDSGQSSPWLWVPNPYSLSPTRRSKPAFQWQGTNERIYMQWQQGTKRTKDRHGGTNSHMGRSYLSCDMRDRVLFRTAWRDHYPAAQEFATVHRPEHLIFPSESS